MERRFGGRRTLSASDKTGVEGPWSVSGDKTEDSSVNANLQTDLISRKPSHECVCMMHTHAHTIIYVFSPILFEM